MVFVALSLVIQLFCVIHVVRSGRNNLWIMVIVFFSLLGCFAYFLFEIMPTMGFNRDVRAAQAAASKKLDPERELRTARAQLDMADTVQAQIAMGDALAGLGRHADAIPYFRQALERAPGADSGTTQKLARALLENGEAKEALDLVERIPPDLAIGATDRRALLRARILEALGRKDEAATIYADIVTRLPGDEARCRYAALLLELGRKREAEEVLAEVERRMKHLDRARRRAEAPMYDWAMQTLQELRGLAG